MLLRQTFNTWVEDFTSDAVFEERCSTARNNLECVLITMKFHYIHLHSFTGALDKIYLQSVHSNLEELFFYHNKGFSALKLPHLKD